MSKAMVTLEIDEYLELLEFKKVMENNNAISIYRTFDGYSDKSLKIITKDESVETIANQLKECMDLNTKLKDRNTLLEMDNIELKENNEDLEYKISTIKDYSIWEFLKFRKQI